MSTRCGYSCCTGDRTVGPIEAHAPLRNENMHNPIQPQARNTRPRPSARLAVAANAMLLTLLAACGDVTDSPPAALNCDTPGVVKSGDTEIPVAPGGYAAVGNKIINSATCQPHRFVGVSRPPLGYRPSDERMGGALAAADFATIRGWKANVVRIEVSQNFWVPTARWYDPAYPGRVDEAVKAARAAGLSVILALQTSDRGDPNYPGDIYNSNPQQEMADVNHSVPFWRDLASRYKDDGNVLFDLFSEPFWAFQGYNSNWDIWLNGGRVPAARVYDEPRPSYQAAGMQQLYDVVRSTGAQNMVIIAGTHWGYYLDSIPKYRVKGHNIAYSAHPWDWVDKQPDRWEKDWAFLAETDPVMLTETGNYDCTTGYLAKVLDKADELDISWVAWSWSVATGAPDQAVGNEPTCKAFDLLTDWSGTPSYAGRVVKDRLARY